MRKVVLLFNLVLLGFGLNAQQAYHIAFYNVENLFDLVDNPLTLDDEFTPTGTKLWTEE